MIFVTVGTHEQPFNRLIKEIDRLKAESVIKDDVFIQTGFSDYRPKFCKWNKLISYNDMSDYIEKADLIISHGGPATFMEALSKGKRIIVVPRLKKYAEHVNDHQLDFAIKVEQLYNNLKVVNDVSELSYLIAQASENTISKNVFNSNNEQFNKKLNSLVKELVEVK